MVTAAYLDLLAATHTLTRVRHAMLSVATNQIESVRGMRAPGEWASGRPHWWSSSFLRDVAREVDQIAVMSYDSGMPLEAVYSGYLKAQTQLALQVVPPDVGLLMGVPAYHDGGFLHTNAETVASAAYSWWSEAAYLNAVSELPFTRTSPPLPRTGPST